MVFLKLQVQIMISGRTGVHKKLGLVLLTTHSKFDFAGKTAKSPGGLRSAHNQRGLMAAPLTEIRI